MRPRDAVKAARALVSDPDVAARVLRVFSASDVQRVTSPSDAADVVRPLLAGRSTEALVCVALDRRRGVVDVAVLTTGNDGCCIVDPAQVYRWALSRDRAVNAVILAHNHPSGDSTPSTQDIDVTERVARAGRVLGVPLLDHIVYSDAGSTSLAERGHLPHYAAASPVTA